MSAARWDKRDDTIVKLRIALEDTIERFEKCLIANGTDEEFAKRATAKAREIMEESRNS